MAKHIEAIRSHVLAHCLLACWLQPHLPLALGATQLHWMIAGNRNVWAGGRRKACTRSLLIPCHYQAPKPPRLPTLMTPTAMARRCAAAGSGSGGSSAKQQGGMAATASGGGEGLNLRSTVTPCMEMEMMRGRLPRLASAASEEAMEMEEVVGRRRLRAQGDPGASQISIYISIYIYTCSCFVRV